MLSYTGVGARKTPDHILEVMEKLGRDLHDQGFNLRSGGAQGADQAFERGALATKQIYIPWSGFNGYVADGGNIVSLHGKIQERARDLAELIHPNFGQCSDFAKLFHTRSSPQILGDKLIDPTQFVVYWAEEDPDGSIRGGTGQAIRLAMHFGIPTFNLKSTDPAEVVTFAKQLRKPQPLQVKNGSREGWLDTFFVGRSTSVQKTRLTSDKLMCDLGNPAVLKGRKVFVDGQLVYEGNTEEEAREYCVEVIFRKHLFEKLHDPCSKECRSLFRLTSLSRARATERIDISCFCAPLKCHGDVISRAVEYINNLQWC